MKKIEQKKKGKRRRKAGVEFKFERVSNLS